MAPLTQLGFRHCLTSHQQESDAHRLGIFRQVFVDGRNARARVFRFGLLMTLASVLATVGILADSTAVVIGAMLVAPLITPMMGMALGLVLGWTSRLRRAASLVAAGIGIAVGVGWIIPALLPIAVEAQANTQIVSRSSPTILDLIVANDEARRTTLEWLGPESDFEIVSLAVNRPTVSIVLTGPGEPPTPQRLFDDLNGSLGGDVVLDLQWIPRQRILLGEN